MDSLCRIDFESERFSLYFRIPISFFFFLEFFTKKISTFLEFILFESCFDKRNSLIDILEKSIMIKKENSRFISFTK